MGFRLKYHIKSKAQSSESRWILLYKSSVLFETQLYMNLSSCVMFENCGELTVAMFSNPANCPLVSELKQGYQFWKTLWSITSKQWEDKDDFTHVIKARHFWVDPWFEELVFWLWLLSRILPLTIRDSKALCMAGPAPVGNRRAASLLLCLHTRFLWLTAAPAKRFKRGIAADLIRRQLPSKREQLSSQYIQYRNVP